MLLNTRLKTLFRRLTCSHTPDTRHTGVHDDSSSELLPGVGSRGRLLGRLPYTNYNLKESSKRSRFRTPPTAWADIHRARALLRRLLPLELVDIILQYAEYYYAIVAYTRHPVHSYASELPILAISLRDTEARNVVAISLIIRGNECPSLHGTTWYSVGTEDPDSHDTPIAHNPPGSSSTMTTHQFRWEVHSSVVQQLKETNVIEVWAHTSTDVALNCIEFAKIEVLCFPLQI
ncbi:hypothetical protein PHLGIDRAFT_374173 [Phlebiopsis gigantea 11061_1 CR5-6]|uniref:Uncharacterized protein n=1 Tax=Phlebiopsis gigantea (strain 11061_1 CR5-6) TaxID=745531 RepID=A0A0C3P9C4_PHLG1|nr:hypothetical protein PHLGIDRAFT_374173 [Phlebiopsis gigantea 11061_1 CR5-6]